MIKKIIIFYFIFLFSVSIISTLSAQTGDAGQPGEFLRYGVGARALGMGHAFTALANDASAVYYNPAGLMGVERKEFTTMYSNLFYDSRYTYMAVALPRTFTGSSNALGFGWVNLTMANFDGRDIGNNQTGNFDIYQQAFLLSGAREWVGTWGILNYGVNFKLINQGFPGYQAEQGWGFGADVGATFKPINAPLFKIFALRFLMPLQLGVSLQNLLPPRVGVGENRKDEYPFIFRWGVGYSVHIKNWHVQLLYDHEKYSGRATGHYTGLETNLPFLPYTESYAPKFRFGYNSRTKRPGFGAGFKFGFAGNANIRLDFAYSLKPQDELKDDFRLFLTVDFGRNYDANYFAAKIDSIDTADKQKRNDHLQVIARLPDDRNKLTVSAEALGGTYDTTNAIRYYRLIGGMRLANEYFNQAKEKLREGNEKTAKMKAMEAIIEYTPEFNNFVGKFTETDLLNFSECLIILGKWEDAKKIMDQVEKKSLRFFYQMGICDKRLGNYDLAINHFKNAISYKLDDKSMIKLAYLNLAECLFDLKKYQSSIDTLLSFNRNYSSILDFDYPRYPTYHDQLIGDDIFFNIGNCYLMLGDKHNALEFFSKIERYFLKSDVSKKADISNIIKKILGEIFNYDNS